MSEVPATESDNTPRIDYAKYALDWESSKLNQSAYCALHELDYSRFVTARSKLLLSRGIRKTRKQPEKFIPVHLKQIPQALEPSHTDKITIRLAKGSVIELPCQLNSQQLSAIFKVLS